MTTAAHQPTPKAPTKEALGERRFVAYTLRAQGMKFADIGKRMNISAMKIRIDLVEGPRHSFQPVGGFLGFAFDRRSA